MRITEHQENDFNDDFPKLVKEDGTVEHGQNYHRAEYGGDRDCKHEFGKQYSEYVVVEDFVVYRTKCNKCGLDRSWRYRQSSGWEDHLRIMEKMDKSFQASFVGDPSDKPTNTVPQVIPFDINDGIPKIAHRQIKIKTPSNDEEFIHRKFLKLYRKILHIGGMCGAVRDPNDILRDIAKMCSEELE